jgi:hypothetical protein
VRAVTLSHRMAEAATVGRIRARAPDHHGITLGIADDLAATDAPMPASGTTPIERCWPGEEVRARVGRSSERMGLCKQRFPGYRYGERAGRPAVDA